MVNPLTRCTEDSTVPPFSKRLITNIVPAIRWTISEYTFDLNAIEDDMASAETDISWVSVMDRLEIIDAPLSLVYHIVLHLCKVVDSPELREAKAEILEEVLVILGRRQQSLDIYKAMKTLQDGLQWSMLTAPQQGILNTALLEAKLGGVALPGADKDRFNAINICLSQLSDSYSKNLMDAIKSSSLLVHERCQLDGLPLSQLALLAQNAQEDSHAGATAANGPWKLSLDELTFTAVLEACSNAATREMLYRARQTKDGLYANESIMKEQQQLQQGRTRLINLGSIANKNITDTVQAQAREISRELDVKCIAKSSVELQELQAFAAAHGQLTPLESWDFHYWARQMRQDKFGIDDEALRAYFPLPTVLTRLFDFVSKVFGLRMERLDGFEQGWHPDVQLYQIRDLETTGEPLIAQLYLDLYSRPLDKQGGAWIDILVTRSTVLRSEKLQAPLPVFALSLNQPPQIAGDLPSLMTFAQVESLFYTVGLVVHSALAQSSLNTLAPLESIGWEAASLTGHLLQNFCYHRETIQTMSSHVETGECLPDKLFDKILAARTFMAASTFVINYHSLGSFRQCLYHTSGPAWDSTPDVAPVLLELGRHKRSWTFYHIFSKSNSSCLDCLLMSEKLAADAFATFEAVKSGNAWMTIGRKFRDTVIAQLGSPLSIVSSVEKFTGRTVSFQGLNKHCGFEST
ncbi:hypothetical protein LEN26_012878 [Aphanomyces euteiches]|nr:hypothetical protein LEN26_012878 [Aphanomyces euteiches]